MTRHWTVDLGCSGTNGNDRKLFGPGCLLGGEWLLRHGQWQGGKHGAEHGALHDWRGFGGDRQWPVELVLRRQQRRNDRKLFGPGCLLGGERLLRHGQWQGGKHGAEHGALHDWRGFGGDRQWPMELVLRRQQRRNHRKLFSPIFALADKWSMRPRQWRGGEHCADHRTLLSWLGLVGYRNRAMELVVRRQQWRHHHIMCGPV